MGRFLDVFMHYCPIPHSVYSESIMAVCVLLEICSFYLQYIISQLFILFAYKPFSVYKISSYASFILLALSYLSLLCFLLVNIVYNLPFLFVSNKCLV